MVSLMLTVLFACDKVIEVDLPTYQQELVLEMYIEQGQPLRCLLIESLPYTDTAINKPVNDALVIFSDGIKKDTLSYKINQDIETGRVFNYYNPKLVTGEPNKSYTLTIIVEEKEIWSETSFSQKLIDIESLIAREAVSKADSFSVGLVFSDPVETEDYYRILIGKNVSDFRSEPSDVRMNDISFNGKSFSYFSEPHYAIGDTVIVRLYSLSKDHYQYLESMGNARRSNFNPFSQPGRIKSNVSGGLGIFTSILFTEQKIVIQ